MIVKGKNGKEYDYDYKQVFLKPEVLEKFNDLRKKTKLTYSQLLTELMEKKDNTE